MQRALRVFLNMQLFYGKHFGLTFPLNQPASKIPHNYRTGRGDG